MRSVFQQLITSGRPLAVGNEKLILSGDHVSGVGRPSGESGTWNSAARGSIILHALQASVSYAFRSLSKRSVANQLLWSLPIIVCQLVQIAN